MLKKSLFICGYSLMGDILHLGNIRKWLKNLGSENSLLLSVALAHQLCDDSGNSVTPVFLVVHI